MSDYEILSREGILHQQWVNAQNPNIPAPGVVYAIISDIRAAARFVGLPEPRVSFVSALVYALGFFALSLLPIVAIKVIGEGIDWLSGYIPFPRYGRASGNGNGNGNVRVGDWRLYTPIVDLARPHVYDAVMTIAFEVATLANSLFALVVAMFGIPSSLVGIVTFILWCGWFLLGRHYILTRIPGSRDHYIKYGIWLHTALLVAFLALLGDQVDDGILKLYLWLVERYGVAGPAFLRDMAREIALGRFPGAVNILAREAEANFVPYVMGRSA
ncbi:hypothetical protein GGS26DRAFT_575423 [Hypomontagnella submonticulosa]|nr:hypothetical protein GGS26DRAFT_575423 [Hypomontagnella submonticulosa]